MLNKIEAISLDEQKYIIYLFPSSISLDSSASFPIF